MEVFLSGTCPVLTDPTSGIVTCSLGLDGVATAGDTCSYICDNGFVRLAGDAMRTCGSDRSWSGSTVVCGTGNMHNNCTLVLLTYFVSIVLTNYLLMA